MSGLNAEVVASSKAQILVAADDGDLRETLLDERRLVVLRGIINHDYLYGRVV